MIEKGLASTDAIDEVVNKFEQDIGPMNGAKAVAKAWTDPEYKEWLLEDASAAIDELGYTGIEGVDMGVCENTSDLHNVIVCTLCSCFPWPTLGLPPHGTRRRPALDDEPEEEYVVFEGYSVDDEGDQHYLDSHVAYRQAALDAIEYLKKFGYTGEQAYMILSTVPVEGRQSGVVDIPNACSTLAVPKEVFDFDISPSELGEVPDRGQVSITDDPLGD